MKRRILALLLAVLTLTALTAAAFAADTTTEVLGAFNIKGSDGFVLTVDGGTGTGGFYANANKFKLTCTGLPGQYSLVLLLKEDAKQAEGTKGVPTPTESNLQYIDQQNITATTEFILFPKQMEKGTYNVYVSTDSKDLKKVASLEYGEKPKYTLGDVDNDGKINSSDALLVLQHSVEILTLKDNALLAADVDKDGRILSSDALLILQHSVGIKEIS